MVTRFEVAQDLGRVFVGQGLGGLQFHDQDAFDQQVGHIIANERAILVIDLDRMLRLDLRSGLAQPVDEGVFVHLFEVPVPVIDVNVISRLPHLGAQRFEVLHVSSLSWFSSFLSAHRKELKKSEGTDLAAKNAERGKDEQPPNPSLRSLRSLRLIPLSVKFSQQNLSPHCKVGRERQCHGRRPIH